jgi:hypothetical protein
MAQLQPPALELVAADRQRTQLRHRQRSLRLGHGHRSGSRCAQQWSGINIIFNYAEGIYRRAGYGVSRTLFNFVNTGTINLVFTMGALVLMDRFGRRVLILLGCAGDALSHTVHDHKAASVSPPVDHRWPQGREFWRNGNLQLSNEQEHDNSQTSSRPGAVVGVHHRTHQIEATDDRSHNAVILSAARCPALRPAGR